MDIKKISQQKKTKTQVIILVDNNLRVYIAGAGNVYAKLGIVLRTLSLNYFVSIFEMSLDTLRTFYVNFV